MLLESGVDSVLKKCAKNADNICPNLFWRDFLIYFIQ